MNAQTQLISRTNHLRRRTTVLKFALCAAPIAGLICFSPAEAATLTFSGFKDAFQPSNWTPIGTGTGSITADTMTLEAQPGQFKAFTYDTNTLNAYAPTSPTPGKFFVFHDGVLNYKQVSSGAGLFGSVNTAKVVGIGLLSLGSAAVTTVTDFSFQANYKEVPGPLPVAAALGAFAWSRRIRRRLSSATSQA